MDSETLPNQDEKFLFNAHNFNAPDPNEIEEDVYIEPTFTKEELAAAKQKAFQKGKQEGIDETNASIQKRTADLLGQILQNYSPLLMQEDERAKLYETEALRLTSHIFETLYPTLKDHIGYAELHDIIQSIMQTQDTQSHIAIHVNPDMVAQVTSALETATQNSVTYSHVKKDFVVTGDETLDLHAVTMGWKDGGATYDLDALAQKIKEALHERLAPLHANSHDEEVNEALPPETEPSNTHQSDEDASNGAVDNE